MEHFFGNIRDIIQDFSEGIQMPFIVLGILKNSINYIYLHGHYNSESFQYMLYTIYKKIELHNYINNGYIEDGVSPHFFNLPPSLILLILKILRLFLFKLKLRKIFVKRDIT